jgi:hypothetical protein
VQGALHSAPSLGDFGSPQGGSYTRAAPAVTQCRAAAVQLAGGPLNNILTNPDVVPFEQMFRRLPEEGIHDAGVSRQRPYKVELGAFRVPQQMALAVFDFRPDIYRFSGIDPNDAVPVEARRFASQVGYDLQVTGNRPANLRFELEPIPRQEGLGFQPGVDQIENPGFLPINAAYDQVRANSFGATAGGGTSLLPQRPYRYGAPVLPLSLVLTENQTISFEAVIFKPITSPIAFFEMDMAGILVPSNMLEELVRCFDWRRG